jgi:hypothetical protein
VALRESVSRHESAVLASDIVRLAQELGYGYPEQKWINIRDVIVQELEFDKDTQDLSHIVFHECIIRNLLLSPDVDHEHLPRFKQCLIVTVDGRTSEKEMPTGVFSDCIFEIFKNTGETNDAVMELSMPLGCRVMVVVLRKLYTQSGAGRQTSALYRGLDQKGRKVVQDVLHILKQEGLVMESKMGQNTVWLPVRSETARIRRLLVAPTSSRDSLMNAARNLCD